MDLIVASNNKNKIKEIKQILSERFDNILSQSEAGIDIEVVEDGNTFLENAQKKSHAIYEILSREGRAETAVIADDSGLMVDALGGAPGIYSARYAGEPCDDKKNNALLLEKLKNETSRSAKYVCAVSLVTKDGELSGYGEIAGEILHEGRGDGGFGYDPIVFIHTLGKTFAQSLPEEKNKVSHRYKALIDLAEKLK